MKESLAVGPSPPDPTHRTRAPAASCEAAHEREERSRRVGVGERRRVALVERPVDADLRIIPADRAVRRRVIYRRALVADIRDITEHEKAVAEAGRNPELATVSGGERHAGPLRESRRGPAQID